MTTRIPRHARRPSARLWWPRAGDDYSGGRAAGRHRVQGRRAGRGHAGNV